MPKQQGFLNVDLEVGARTRVRLEPLIRALRGRLFELYRGRLDDLYRVHYQINACAVDASATLHELAAAVEALDPVARRAWTNAARRDFNVGVELARGVALVELAIDPDAARRVVALGGRLVFTAYQVTVLQRATRKRARS